MSFFRKSGDDGFCKIRRDVLRDTHVRLARLRLLYIEAITKRASAENREITYEEHLEMQRLTDNVAELSSALEGGDFRISDQEHAWKGKNK